MNNKKYFKHKNLILDGFNIPIFIISLKEDTKRRKGLLKFLPSKIVKNYFEAVDMRYKSRRILDSYCNNKELFKKYKRKLKPGEVGISLSQMQVYKYLIKKNISLALIFEDDVVVKYKNWKIELKLILEEIKYLGINKAILCNLGVSNYNFRRKKILINRYFPKFLKKLCILDLKKSNQKMAHSFLITLQAAKNIVNTNKKISCVNDDWKVFNNQKCFDYFLVSKKIFKQNKLFKSHLDNYKDLNQSKFYKINKFYLIIFNFVKSVICVFYKWFNFEVISENKNN